MVKSWSLSIGFFILLGVGVMLDWDELNLAKNESDPQDQVLITLKACDSYQTDSAGSLAPNSASKDNIPSLSDISQPGLIPISEWSTRAGFSISIPVDPDYWAGMLGAGWYLNWNIQVKPMENAPEHWQMIRVRADCISPSVEVIKSTAASHLGQVWIIGNEPDVIWQDNVTAQRYAVLYHDLYEIIKSSDPTALIAVGGIAQATPLRLLYLDTVLQTYQKIYHTPMPADWWTVHGYVLREEKGSWGVDIPPGIEDSQGELYEVVDHGRIDLFESQLLSFRIWMMQNGYQDTPLALTEYGILMPTSYGFPYEFIADYLAQTYIWLSQATDILTGYPGDDFHLVQKWAWFSLADPTYSSSDLGDLASGKLTLVGEMYRNIIQNEIP